MSKLFIIISALIASIVAAHSSPEFPSEEQMLERTRAAFDTQLNLTCGRGMQTDWIAEDAVYQFALSGIDVNLRVEGRAGIKEHLCALASMAPDATAENMRYSHTLNPDMVYVQYDLVLTDGGGKRSSALAIIEMRDNQIIQFRQLNRSSAYPVVLEARNVGTD